MKFENQEQLNAYWRRYTIGLGMVDLYNKSNHDMLKFETLFLFLKHEWSGLLKYALGEPGFGLQDIIDVLAVQIAYTFQQSLMPASRHLFAEYARYVAVASKTEAATEAAMRKQRAAFFETELIHAIYQCVRTDTVEYMDGAIKSIVKRVVLEADFKDSDEVINVLVHVFAFLFCYLRYEHP